METAAVVKQKIKRKETKITSIYSRCLITRNIILPITNTSRAKIAPAIGVPKTAPKPAAMPHINKT